MPTPRFTLAAALAATVAAPAAASTFTYTLNPGTPSEQVVTPFVTATSVTDFYSYGTPSRASANPPAPVALRDDEALFLLHRNGAHGPLSFVAIFDRPGTDAQPSGSMSFGLSGAPAAASIVVEDDGGEISSPSNVNQSFSFRWVGCCTDGLAAEGFEDLAWLLGVDVTASSGISSFSFLNGDNTRIDLGEAGDFTLEAAPVPLPATAPLVLAALGGLALMRRRQA